MSGYKSVAEAWSRLVSFIVAPRVSVDRATKRNSTSHRSSLPDFPWLEPHPHSGNGRPRPKNIRAAGQPRFRFWHWDETFVLSFLASEFSGTADGFGLLANAAL